MCIRRFQSVCPVYIPKTKSVYPVMFGLRTLSTSGLHGTIALVHVAAHMLKVCAELECHPEQHNSHVGHIARTTLCDPAFGIELGMECLLIISRLTQPFQRDAEALGRAWDWASSFFLKKQLRNIHRPTASPVAFLCAADF